MSKYIRKPFLSFGKYVVEVCESASPLAKIIERHEFNSQPVAYEAYRQMMKDLGRGL